ncbi:MAG: VOC family protein [Myxococcota bacterium]
MRQIFINLPVSNLKKSMAFFTQLGFKFDPRFTDENAACLIVEENIHVMLLVESYFRSFSYKETCGTNAAEVLLAIDAPNRAKVDELVAKAVSAGGATYNEPKDHGFMYQHRFRDLDGHTWEVAYMDMAAFQAMSAQAGAPAQ